MAYIKTNIGDAVVILESAEIEEPASAVTETQEHSPSTGFMQDTSYSTGFMQDTAFHGGTAKSNMKNVENVFENLLPIARNLANGFSKTFSDFEAKPSELKIGFTAGFNAELNAWLIKGDSSLSINVEMTWKKEEDPKK